MDKSTIQYYNDNAKAYFESVNVANMSETYSRFLKYLPKGSLIVDIGCGSGRDLKFFKEAGYKATGVDASRELCRLASEYSLCPVICSDFLSWESDKPYDAFWANASLLHLKAEEIITFFRTKAKYLKEDGIIYFSMKSGIEEGFDAEGRFFTPFSENLLNAIISDGKFSMIDRWSNVDSLQRTGFKWECIILKKNR